MYPSLTGPEKGGSLMWEPTAEQACTDIGWYPAQCLQLHICTPACSRSSDTLVLQMTCRVTLDPGLKAVLTLIPPPLDAALLSKYNTTSGNSTRPAVLHRRALLQYTNQDELPYQLPPLPELLQQGTLEQQVAIATQRHLLQTSSDTKSNTTSYIVTGDLTYFADYESVEAPDPESPYFTAPVLPPSGNQTQNISAILGNNSSSAAGPVMGPDLGNLVQDFLSKEPGVTTVQGMHSSQAMTMQMMTIAHAAVLLSTAIICALSLD